MTFIATYKFGAVYIDEEQTIDKLRLNGFGARRVSKINQQNISKLQKVVGFDHINNEQEIQEPLLLLDEEAVFLSQRGYLQVYQMDHTELSLESLWGLSIKKCSKFAVKYKVYSYFKDKSYVVRTGLNFGVDYCIYRSLPSECHSEMCVTVIDAIQSRNIESIVNKRNQIKEQPSIDSGIKHSINENRCEDKLSWRHVTTLTRIIPDVHKLCIVCYVLPAHWQEPKVQTTGDASEESNLKTSNNDGYEETTGLTANTVMTDNCPPILTDITAIEQYTVIEQYQSEEGEEQDGEVFTQMEESDTITIKVDEANAVNLDSDSIIESTIDILNETSSNYNNNVITSTIDFNNADAGRSNINSSSCDDECSKIIDCNNNNKASSSSETAVAAVGKVTRSPYLDSLFFDYPVPNPMIPNNNNTGCDTADSLQQEAVCALYDDSTPACLSHWTVRPVTLTVRRLQAMSGTYPTVRNMQSKYKKAAKIKTVSTSYNNNKNTAYGARNSCKNGSSSSSGDGGNTEMVHQQHNNTETAADTDNCVNNTETAADTDTDISSTNNDNTSSNNNNNNSSATQHTRLLKGKKTSRATVGVSNTTAASASSSMLLVPSKKSNRERRDHTLVREKDGKSKANKYLNKLLLGSSNGGEDDNSISNNGYHNQFNNRKTSDINSKSSTNNNTNSKNNKRTLVSKSLDETSDTQQSVNKEARISQESDKNNLSGNYCSIQ